MVRQPIICGNWKMYKTIEEATGFIETLAPLITQSQVHVYLAVPFTAIYPAAIAAQNTAIIIGAQNMNDAAEGAFTGEIAGKMIKEAGAKFVILGHSERRIYFGETDQIILKKVQRALLDEIQPIVCIGEKIEERDAGINDEVLSAQLEGSVGSLSADQAARLIIAYEPVWAIGTGKIATPEVAQKQHLFCREWMAAKWGQITADQIKILYGGSVKPDNISALMAQPDIDGALVGGASLSAVAFNEIIHYAIAKMIEKSTFEQHESSHG